MKNTRKGDGRRNSEKYRAVNLFNNRSTRLWNITWLEKLMKQLKQGVTHHITPLVRPSPCAWGLPHHPDKYHSIMDSCFGFVRPQQYSVAYTCQNFFFVVCLRKICEIFALHDILFNHPIAETYFSGTRGEWRGDGRGSYKLRMPLHLPSQQETLTWRDWGPLIKMAAIYLAAGSLLRKRYRSLS